MRYFIFTFFILSSTTAFAQDFPSSIKKYWVEFTNKDTTLFSIDSPEVFLSERAIKRRTNQNISITENDFPVNKSYLNEIETLGGKIQNTSKWLNAASIIIEENKMQHIDSLPFVVSTSYVGKHLEQKLLLRRSGKIRDTIPPVEKIENYYGHGENQIKMLKGDFLHDAGFRGKGMLIAVLDGGFSNVDIMPFFDSLRADNRLIFNYDFVESDTFVYESSSHGSQVLSTMASNIPGLLVGTCPDATYLCLKTEDVRNEYLIEECNWVAALEYADSVGVDVINSSLGYTHFSDTTMNYRYENLDGKTGIATRAATIAAQKGIIVVSSAGNEGNSKWKYIDVPADAEGILTIGAVTPDKSRARFSSIGPSADGRIKPDVVALGQRAAVASIYAPKAVNARGTSFSAPILAGLVAALWQAFPNKTNFEIMEAIRQSGHLSHSPDFELGFGIPDFFMAYQLLKTNP